MRLLHLSDPHFGTEVPPVVEAVVQLAQALAPDVLVLSGDVTQRARRAQFAAAQQFVERLPAPHRIVIAGNHDVPLYDVPTRALSPYRHFQRHFGDELEPALERDDLKLLAVRTTRRWRHKHGEVDAAQIERVAGELRSARPEQLRIVVVHQPMHVPRPEDEHNLLRNAEAAARAWSRAGADLVLGGHIHLPFLLPMSERYAGLSRELWAVNAGTAVSQRIRHEAPNSLNVIEYEQGAAGCRVQRWDCHPPKPFERVAEQVIALQR
jgi:3',5'-cyclic AMP phosphodiesterase CpdA